MRLLPLAIALGVVAFNLRPSITSVGPLLPSMEDDLGLSSAESSILTALPVMCFALVSPATPRLMRRFRMEHLMIAAFLVVVAGLLVRIGAGIGAVFAGTILVGAAIAVMNVMLPVFVKRDAPDQAGLVTGIYVMTIALGASLGAGLTVPFADAVGGGWRAGLALWALPIFPAALFWALRRQPAARPAEVPDAPSVRGGVDWPVTLFFGLQSGVFYSAIGWLPTVLQDQGLSDATSGALLSVALIVGIPLGLLAPVIASRRSEPRLDVAVFVVLSAVGLAGLVAFPSVPLLWMIIYGIGTGGTFPLALMLVVNRSADQREAERKSSVAQTLGYSMAIAAPLTVGALHSLTGSWAPPLVLLALIMLFPCMLSGLAAANVEPRPE